MLPTAPFLRQESLSKDVLIHVHVTPGARKCQLGGVYDADTPALRIKLQAQPVEGQANEALIRFLAKRLGIGQRDLTLVRGQASRQKQLRVGADAARLATWERLLQAD